MVNYGGIIRIHNLKKNNIRLFRKHIFLFIIFFNILSIQICYSAWCESSKSGAWNDPTVWSCNLVPGNGDGIRINPNHTVTYNGNFNFTSGQIQLNGGSLQILGNFSIGSSASIGSTSSGGELFINGSFSLGTSFSVDGGLQVIVTNNMSIPGNLYINNGLVVVFGNLNKSGTITLDNNSNLVVAGDYTSTGGSTWPNGSTDIYIFGDNSCTDPGCSYSNVQDQSDWQLLPNPPGQIYIANGSITYTKSGTFIVPSDVSTVTVQCWGGGGGGGGSSKNKYSGGGGGGGAYSNASYTTLSPGDPYTITVGAGGSGGLSGGNGGNSSFGNLVIANGGSGGSVGDGSWLTSGIGGIGGAAGSYSGGNGSNGHQGTEGPGGGGGSSGGTGSDGNPGSIPTGGLVTGGGSGGDGGAISATGNPGISPGGGGGGAGDRQNTNLIGGNGANGQVIVSWTSCAPNTISLTSGSENQTICLGNSITTITYSTTGATGATITGLPGGVSGSWSSNVLTIIGTPNASGTFNYQVTLTGGCGTATASGTITVNPTPSSPSAGYLTPVCVGGNLSLTASTITGASYSWSGPGFTSSSQNPVINNITSANSGTYSVTATINGCISPAGTVDIIVNTIPVGTQDDITICSEDYTYYTPDITPESTFTWIVTGSVLGASDNLNPTNIIDQQLTIPSNVTQDNVVYHVTPISTTGSCVGLPFNITVNVEHPAIGGFN